MGDQFRKLTSINLFKRSIFVASSLLGIIEQRSIAIVYYEGLKIILEQRIFNMKNIHVIANDK